MPDGLAAAETATAGSLLGSNGVFFLFIALAFGALWLMSSRGRKQQREQEQMRSNLAPGDEVMTASGLYGTVVSADGDVVVLETSPGVTSRWVRQAILKKVDPQDAVEQDEPEAVEDTDDRDEFEVPDDISSIDDRKGKDD
jgi:preprotein translocase subunit YajC